MSAPCPRLGFTIRIEPRATIDFTALSDDLLRLARAHGLVVTRRRHAFEFEITREGSQAMQIDRELALDWAARWNRVAEIAVSELEDMDSAAGD